MGFAAKVRTKAGIGFRASAAFCERSNTFSLCPSLGPLLDATVSAPVLLRKGQFITKKRPASEHRSWMWQPPLPDDGANQFPGGSCIR
jgi:hypothetical protein